MRPEISSQTEPLLTVIVLTDNLVQYDRLKASLAGQHRETEVQWIAAEPADFDDNAAKALNHGLSQARAPWVVCARQDVLFPDGWWPRARKQIARWERRRNRPVALAGLVGVTKSGAFRGSVCDSNGLSRWPALPAAVHTLDEHVMILRRACGLRFDENIPGLHGYGADFALQAAQHNMEVIVIDAPVLHLSTATVDPAPHDGAEQLLDKWSEHCNGVIPTGMKTIVRHTATNAPRRWLVACNRQLSLARRRWSMAHFPRTPIRRWRPGMLSRGG